MLDISDSAPDFTLKSQNDEDISINDFKGKWIVLYFYPKDNTSGCTKEACDFTAAMPDFEKLEAAILGISPDSPSTHRKFIEKHQIGFTLLSDPDKTTMKKYDAWGVKKNYGKEYEGVIRSTFIISPELEIAALWRNVKVRRKQKGVEILHADTVRKKLVELQSK